MASIAGTLIRGDQRPEVPKWDPVSPSQQAGVAIAGNLKNFDEAAQLGARTNEELITQHLAALERLMPGFSGLNQQITSNIASQARGELPQDVENFIGRKAAEMGITTGTSGSQFNKYGQLRNLGITSLQMTDQALSSAQRWMQTVTSGAPRFSFASMFISPELQVEATFRNRENQWQRQWLKNQIDVMPGPVEEAFATLFDNIEATGRSFLSSWGSAAAGGGGMGGGGGTSQMPTQQPYSRAEMAGMYNSGNYAPGY